MKQVVIQNKQNCLSKITNPEDVIIQKDKIKKLKNVVIEKDENINKANELQLWRDEHVQHLQN
jgi:hypothetical protein